MKCHIKLNKQRSCHKTINGDLLDDSIKIINKKIKSNFLYKRINSKKEINATFPKIKMFNHTFNIILKKY